MVPKIRTSNTVLREIELIVSEKSISYIDAALYYCEKNNLEPDMIGDMIRASPIFKNKVQIEAEKLNFLPKATRLPI
jgi:hypothetical protein